MRLPSCEKLCPQPGAVQCCCRVSDILNDANEATYKRLCTSVCSNVDLKVCLLVEGFTAVGHGARVLLLWLLCRFRGWFLLKSEYITLSCSRSKKDIPQWVPVPERMLSAWPGWPSSKCLRRWQSWGRCLGLAQSEIA